MSGDIVNIHKIRMNNILKTSNFEIITSTSQTISLTTDYTYFSLPLNYSLDGEQNPEFDLDNPVESISKYLKLLNAKSGNVTIRTSFGSFVLSFTNPQITLLYDTNVGYWTQKDAPWYVTTQMGAKLVGAGYSGTTIQQGRSVSLSANGDTLAIGGYLDNTTLGDDIGATWIFVRNGTTWTQQDKLVGIGGASGDINQGTSVSLSADGNTLAVGGPIDDSSIGATWVFVRNGTIWSQQGSKLVGVGNIGVSHQGSSVSLSSDGNTLAIGGRTDDTSIGATWIFVRNGTIWTQQGSKLVGAGNIGIGFQGVSVSLSADGNTLAVAGILDNSFIGATWIFVRNGTIWSQQGNKLVGTGNIGNSFQGSTVSLSADGNTLAVGGYQDNSFIGATWIFTRSNNVWTQEGKLIGTGFSGTPNQGISVNLSANGKTLAIGGPDDNTNNGATWIFTKSNGIWSQQGTKIIGAGGTGVLIRQGFSVALSSNGNILAVGGQDDDSSIGATWVFH